MADPNPLLPDGTTYPPPLVIPGSERLSVGLAKGKRTPNPFITPPKERVNPHGVRSERRVAKALGATLQPGSGAPAAHKGDFKLECFLMEAKSTTAASLPIQLSYLIKISEEALSKGMQPALTLSFVLPDGRPKPNCVADWVAVPLPVWQEMLEKCNG